jgi:hypothetical protein
MINNSPFHAQSNPRRRPSSTCIHTICSTRLSQALLTLLGRRERGGVAKVRGRRGCALVVDDGLGRGGRGRVRTGREGRRHGSARDAEAREVVRVRRLKVPGYRSESVAGREEVGGLVLTETPACPGKATWVGCLILHCSSQTMGLPCRAAGGTSCRRPSHSRP